MKDIKELEIGDWLDQNPKSQHVILGEQFKELADKFYGDILFDARDVEKRFMHADKIDYFLKQFLHSDDRSRVVGLLDGKLQVATIRKIDKTAQTVFLYEFESGKREGELLTGKVRSVCAVNSENLNNWSAQDRLTFDSRNEYDISIFYKNGKLYELYVPAGTPEWLKWIFNPNEERKDHSYPEMIRAYLDEFPEKIVPSTQNWVKEKLEKVLIS